MWTTAHPAGPAPDFEFKAHYCQTHHLAFLRIPAPGGPAPPPPDLGEERVTRGMGKGLRHCLCARRRAPSPTTIPPVRPLRSKGRQSPAPSGWGTRSPETGLGEEGCAAASGSGGRGPSPPHRAPLAKLLPAIRFTLSHPYPQHDGRRLRHREQVPPEVTHSGAPNYTGSSQGAKGSARVPSQDTSCGYKTPEWQSRGWNLPHHTPQGSTRHRGHRRRAPWAPIWGTAPSEAPLGLSGLLCGTGRSSRPPERVHEHDGAPRALDAGGGRARRPTQARPRQHERAVGRHRGNRSPSVLARLCPGGGPVPGRMARKAR